MIHVMDYYFDFEKMVAYRGIDYRNFNIRTREAKVLIKVDRDFMYRFSEEKDQWILFSASDTTQSIVMQAYREWLDNEIDSIVL